VTASLLESMQVDQVHHIDAAGVIRWLNRAAENLVGNVRGRPFTSVVAPEATRRAKELFARKIVGGTEVTKLLRAVGAYPRLEAVAIAHNSG
jgi:hypothetical protein